MSSTQEGSSGFGPNNKKPDRNCRSWTFNEETTLIATMKEMIAQGWKSKNGFRPGYLRRLELKLKKVIPEADLKAVPHINSRITSWKKTYGSLTGILTRTGVGFNLYGNFMIDCEDEQWEQIKKADPNARLIRVKQYTHYDSWCELFGKNHANGEMAEDIGEAAADLQQEDLQIPADDMSGDTEFSYENDYHEMAFDQASQSARDGHASRAAGKKRKVSELQNVCQLLAERNQATDEKLEQLANRIGYEFDMGVARQETFDQLAEIPGLFLENRFIVCEIVTFKAERLDMWRGMKREARPQYMEHLLRTRDRALYP